MRKPHGPDSRPLILDDLIAWMRRHFALGRAREENNRVDGLE